MSPAARSVDAEVARLARRVRQWREAAGLTLQELAGRSGVAASTIQKVESCQMVPSVTVAIRIARGLGRSAGELVGEPAPRASVLHLAPAERRPVGSPSRIRIERLSGDLEGAVVETWRLSVQPRCSSGREPFAYEGEELVLGEAGAISYEIGDEKYLLRAGDVLHFKASIPHRWRNAGRTTARFIVMSSVSPALRRASPRTLADGARRRGLNRGEHP